MAALIQFPAVDVQMDGLGIDQELPTAWLATALQATEVEPGSEPGHIKGRLSRSGTQDIVVRAHIRVTVYAPCARCLEPSAVPVDTELSLLLQPLARNAGSGRGRSNGSRERPGELEYEFTSAEADMDVYDGEMVILDDFVREAILLEVPTFPLCRGSCPGIVQHESPTLEEARAFDPRLAPLDAFRDKSGPTTIDDLVAAAAQRSASIHGKKPILKTNRAVIKKKKKR
ncbi:MAG: DUF177 domain-containing protein [Polyangiaceae bacterium]